MSPVLDEWLPESHLARFVADLVDGVLDLGPIYDSYTETRGFPPHDPRLMLRLLVYGYCTGVRSSRGIERRCTDDVAFRYLAAGQVPDFRSIAKFRRRHLEALAGLLLQTLRLAQQAGMVRLGRVALDGTKLRAAASKHKAMSYGRLVEREARLEAEVAELETQIQAMLTEAEAADTAEDARLGADRGEEDLPAELARRETRLAKLQAARASLEAEAAEKARAKAEAAERRRAQRRGQTVEEDQVAAAGQAAAEKARPEDKAQRNFTDPDSRIMKNGDGAFIQAYNGQAVVDEDNQIVIAADVTTSAADVASLDPMLDQAAANTGQAPEQAVIDAGYCSEANLAAAEGRQAEHGTDTLIATGRLKHDQPAPAAPEPTVAPEQPGVVGGQQSTTEPSLADTTAQATSPASAVTSGPTAPGQSADGGHRPAAGPRPPAPEPAPAGTGSPPPAGTSARERMAARLRTPAGRADYARRKAIVEPVFGQVHIRQNGKQLLLRGEDAARAEWRLLLGCHNIHKLFQKLGTATLLTPARA